MKYNLLIYLETKEFQCLLNQTKHIIKFDLKIGRNLTSLTKIRISKKNLDLRSGTKFIS